MNTSRRVDESARIHRTGEFKQQRMNEHRYVDTRQVRIMEENKQVGPNNYVWTSTNKQVGTAR